MELTRTLDSHSDVRALDYFGFDLPEGATLYGDKAYNDYFIEDELKAGAGVSCSRSGVGTRSMLSNSMWPMCSIIPGRWSDAGSLTEQMLPKSIHAVTARGFELKVVLFVPAYGITCGLWATTWVTVSW